MDPDGDDTSESSFSAGQIVMIIDALLLIACLPFTLKMYIVAGCCNDYITAVGV